MIVVTTSWAPETALRKPGMNPVIPPAIIPNASATGMATIGGAELTATPAATAPRAPIRNWPWAPMLNSPALKPTATDRPPRTSGAVATSVFRMAPGLPNEPSSRARYAVTGRVGIERSLGDDELGEEDDDRSHQQGQDDREQRQGDDLPDLAGHAARRSRRSGPAGGHADIEWAAAAAAALS